MAWNLELCRPQPDMNLRNSPREPSPPQPHKAGQCAPQEELITPLSVRTVKKEVKEVAKEVADVATDAAAPGPEAVKKRVGLNCCMRSIFADCCLVHPSRAPRRIRAALSSSRCCLPQLTPILYTSQPACRQSACIPLCCSVSLDTGTRPAAKNSQCSKDSCSGKTG